MFGNYLFLRIIYIVIERKVFQKIKLIFIKSQGGFFCQKRGKYVENGIENQCEVEIGIGIESQCKVETGIVEEVLMLFFFVSYVYFKVISVGI